MAIKRGFLLVFLIILLSSSVSALYMMAPDTYSVQLQADGTEGRLTYHFSIPDGSKVDIKYQTLGDTTTTSNLYKADGTFITSTGGSLGGGAQANYGNYEAGDYYFDIFINGGGSNTGVADIQFIFYDYLVPTPQGGVLVNWDREKEDTVKVNFEDVEVVELSLTPCPKAVYEFYDPDDKLVAKSSNTKSIYPTLKLFKPKSGVWTIKVKDKISDLPYSPLKFMYHGGKIEAEDTEVVEEEEEWSINGTFLDKPELYGPGNETEEEAEHEFDVEIPEDNRIGTQIILTSNEYEELDTCSQLRVKSFLWDLNNNPIGGSRRLIIRIPCELRYKDCIGEKPYRDYTYYTDYRGGTEQLILDFLCRPQSGTYTISSYFEGDATYKPSSKKQTIYLKPYEPPGEDPVLKALKGIDGFLRDAGSPVNDACNRIPEVSLGTLLTENIKTGSEDADALINCIKDSLVEMADDTLLEDIDLELIPGLGEVVGGLCLVAECAASDGYDVCINSGIELTKMLAQQKKFEMLIEAFETLDDVKKLKECFPKLTDFLTSEIKKRVTGMFRSIKSYNLFDKFGDLDMHIYDKQGNHVGMNYETGEFENEIKGAIATGDWIAAQEMIFIPANLEVEVFVDARDAEEKEEEYTLLVEQYEDGKPTLTQSIDQKIKKNQVMHHEHEFSEDGIVVKQGVAEKKGSFWTWFFWIIVLGVLLYYANKKFDLMKYIR